MVLGCRIPIAVIERNVRRMWKDCEVLDVISVGSWMIFVRFSNDKRFEQILRRRDWDIVGCPLMVRRWILGITYESLELSNLPLWIKLKNIPF